MIKVTIEVESADGELKVVAVDELTSLSAESVASHIRVLTSAALRKMLAAVES